MSFRMEIGNSSVVLKSSSKSKRFSISYEILDGLFQFFLINVSKSVSQLNVKSADVKIKKYFLL